MPRVCHFTGKHTTFGIHRYSIYEVLPTRHQMLPMIVDGEPQAAALGPSSEFRRLIAGAAPRQTAVTFYVYPDSFALFRSLRDYLYEQNVEVAGTVLPEGQPIIFSRHGTKARSQ